VSVVEADDVTLLLQSDRRTLILYQGRSVVFCYLVQSSDPIRPCSGNVSSTMVVTVQPLDLHEWHVAAVALTRSGVFGTVNNPVVVSQAAPTVTSQQFDIQTVLAAGILPTQYLGLFCLTVWLSPT
jgi:hypothetical protein